MAMQSYSTSLRLCFWLTASFCFSCELQIFVKHPHEPDWALGLKVSVSSTIPMSFGLMGGILAHQRCLIVDLAG